MELVQIYFYYYLSISTHFFHYSIILNFPLLRIHAVRIHSPAVFTYFLNFLFL